MPSIPRMTLPTQRVLSVLLSAPAEEKYGLEISVESKLPSGTIHPILARLEGVGWLESRWEDIDLARAALHRVEARNTRWSVQPAFAGGVP